MVNLDRKFLLSFNELSYELFTKLERSAHVVLNKMYCIYRLWSKIGFNMLELDFLNVTVIIRHFSQKRKEL